MSLDPSEYPGIPEKFPVEPRLVSISGAQPKVALVEEDGIYYQEGTSPSEVLEAYETCEDLAQQFVAYCLKKEAAGFGTHQEILQRVHDSLLQKDWCSKAQSAWVVERTALLLNWQSVH